MMLLCGCGMNAYAEERSMGIDESSMGVRWETLVGAMMWEGFWQRAWPYETSCRR
jgi:hypothetical protein